MKTVFHPASERGHANHGWLNSYHSFSFANYYEQSKMNFGVLRVLNDDTVSGGQGFSEHPHQNMEIISIPLSGNLKHMDSMGNVAIIKEGDVQVMSAGTGITHAEYNNSSSEEVKFLQIWVFPKESNIEPRYDQISLKEEDFTDAFLEIVSPENSTTSARIHQEAWFYLGKFKSASTQKYHFKSSSSGLYIFVLEGSVNVEGQILGKRDALGIWETSTVAINCDANSKILLMEVPMELKM